MTLVVKALILIKRKNYIMDYIYDCSKCIRQNILVCCIPVSVMVILNDGWEGRSSENILHFVAATSEYLPN